MQEGYGVIVLNTNYNRDEANGDLIRVRVAACMDVCMEYFFFFWGGGGVGREREKIASMK